MAGGYRNLTVWQKSIKLVVLIYKLTKVFPPAEIYGITSQMKRCVISIPSNVAEGSKRKTSKDFKYFISIALGSGAELETQIEICKQLKLAKAHDYSEIDSLLTEIMKMLATMVL